MTVVKGCRDAANCWHRSPLGRSGGMQFYLWCGRCREADPPVVTSSPTAAGSWTSVRHHDDHTRVNADVLDDYLTFSQHEIDDVDLSDGRGRPTSSSSYDTKDRSD